MQFLLAQSSSLAQSLWWLFLLASLSSQFVVIFKLAEGAFKPILPNLYKAVE